jgi:hypothetical protein
MTTVETTTNTALTTDREALRTAFKAQKDAAFAGLDELQKLAEIGMKEYEDMRRSELSQAFRAIHEAASAVGLKVQQIAETVGCEDYPNLNFKPTVKADARVQKLQAAINVIDIYVKDTAGKLMGVSALAAIAVENQGVALTGANLWPTFHALGDMARETESLVESVTA